MYFYVVDDMYFYVVDDYVCPFIDVCWFIDVCVCVLCDVWLLCLLLYTLGNAFAIADGGGTVFIVLFLFDWCWLLL